jgi:DNA mismatch endonuclease (patch repair protein)
LKIEGNRQRDRDTNMQLRKAGWKVIRVWEHEDPVAASLRIIRVVRARSFTADDTVVQTGISAGSSDRVHCAETKTVTMA